MTDKEKELFAEAMKAIQQATLDFVKLIEMSRQAVLKIQERTGKMRDLTKELPPGFSDEKFGKQPPPRT